MITLLIKSNGIFPIESPIFLDKHLKTHSKNHTTYVSLGK